MRNVLACVLAIYAIATPAGAGVPEMALRPVPIVSQTMLDVTTARGSGAIPVFVSRDWSGPLPDVTRAIVYVHGLTRRDVRSGELAAQAAGTLAAHSIVITPQFLIAADVDVHRLPDDVLRWGPEDWKAGFHARGPVPLSSFDALDAILLRLADRHLFPKLEQVVVAGHSAGGQFVQRYAAIGHGEAPLIALGIHIRYVVANPSSYVYFSPARPVTEPDVARSCPAFDDYPYGFHDHFPGYLTTPVDPPQLERSYLARDVVYLLGTADTDPNHVELDRSCSGELEGATRFARGLAYIAALRAQNPAGFTQRLLEVPGVGHDSAKMLTSACGLQALFDEPGCADTKLDTL